MYLHSTSLARTSCATESFCKEPVEKKHPKASHHWGFNPQSRHSRPSRLCLWCHCQRHELHGSVKSSPASVPVPDDEMSYQTFCSIFKNQCRSQACASPLASPNTHKRGADNSLGMCREIFHNAVYLLDLSSGLGASGRALPNPL